MKDEPMVGTGQITFGNDPKECLLDRMGCRTRRESRPVRHAEDVRIDRDGRCAIEGIQNDIGAFAPDAGQLLQIFAAGWNASIESFQEQAAAFEQVPRFDPEESKAPEMGFDAIGAEGEKRCGSRGNLEELGSCAVDLAVGRLGGKKYGREELKRSLIVEFSDRMWASTLQAGKKSGCPTAWPGPRHRVRIPPDHDWGGWGCPVLPPAGRARRARTIIRISSSRSASVSPREWVACSGEK